MFDTSEFLDYCGMIGEPQEFIGVLIKPDGIAGQFYPPRLQEMLEYCDWFPEYSIISKMPCGALINQPKLGAQSYFLANLNRSDERIVCHSVYNLSYCCKVAGYKFTSEANSLTLEQFLRARGLGGASGSDPNGN